MEIVAPIRNFLQPRWIIPALVVVLVGGYWVLRPRPPIQPDAFVSERSATVWSSLAQVRQPLATLRYGEPVYFLERRGTNVRVRTSAHMEGWVAADRLMEAALWQRGKKLIADAARMPVQAVGRTKAPSNVRLEPGRTSPRSIQLNRNVYVEVLARAVADAPAAEEKPTAAESSRTSQPVEQAGPRREDWLLVRAQVLPAADPLAAAGPNAPAGPPVAVVGWVRGQFVALDLPEPVRDYASSSGLRVTAFFELNRVPDSLGEKPQYLAVGTRGGEGQTCDFTLLRVYTWGTIRQRYETAYLESDFCGFFPVRVSSAPNGDPEFRFKAGYKIQPGFHGPVYNLGKEERLYRMRQTVVRRIRDERRPLPNR